MVDYVEDLYKFYKLEEILAMEKAILGKLEWSLTVLTPFVFLVHFIKASMADQKESQMENLAFFMAIMYCPSMLAASAVYATRWTLYKSPFWNETLKFHIGIL